MTVSYNKVQPEELHKLGLKQTPARLGVLKILENQTSPLDALTIHSYLREKNLKTDPATVYRILDVFYQKGIVSRFELEEGKFRYELTAEDHHHIVCESCGKIEDVSDCEVDKVEKQIKMRKRFLVKRHSLQFYGVCASCQG
ncbi:transcriptional repressor [Candidatus Gottesmanbacteria bacterium]|nr:transcriptional repressor [Candidatus Gottesmanbacteria bacterium]